MVKDLGQADNLNANASLPAGFGRENEREKVRHQSRYKLLSGKTLQGSSAMMVFLQLAEQWILLVVLMFGVYILLTNLTNKH